MKGDDLDVHPAGDGIPECFNALFLLISFGYMLPWTSLGALIAYYKETYSAAFYVKLYCAYYLPGLPVALLQYRFDPYLDWRYGSQRTYLIRGVLSYLVMIAILLSLVWLTTRRALLVLFVSLGVFGWLCHGTASMMASMYPPSAIAYLQTGFRCPEIYTIAAVAILHLGKVRRPLLQALIMHLGGERDAPALPCPALGPPAWRQPLTALLPPCPPFPHSPSTTPHHTTRHDTARHCTRCRLSARQCPT
jgi:hypothetical protein